VLSVHCKDGDWPPKGSPDALGAEKPLGQGSVGMERFIGKLKEIGYRGALNIEREAEDQAVRLADIAMAVKLLEKLRG
jgi:sugar phosphate isomerase/epimerase